MKVTTRSSHLLALLGVALVAGCGQAPTADPAAPAAAEETTTQAAAPAEPAAEAPAAAETAPPQAQPQPAAPRQAPARAAAAPPVSAPEPTPLRLAAGTPIDIRLGEALDSGTATVGQTVTAQVTHPVVVNGRTVVPKGATVQGEVTELQPAKRFGGQGKIGVTFGSVRLPSGQTVALEGTMEALAKKDTAKDTATIAGSAVGGALLGKIIGKDDKDAAIGAVVGGAAGTAVAARKGDEAILEAGTEGSVVVARDATIR